MRAECGQQPGVLGEQPGLRHRHLGHCFMPALTVHLLGVPLQRGNHPLARQVVQLQA